MDLCLFCQLFYSAHFVPITLFQDGNIEQSFTSLDRPLNLWQDLMPWIQNVSSHWMVFTGPDQGLYGLLPVDNGSRTLLVGPVFSHPVSEKMVSAFARQKSLGHRDWSVLYWFLAGIPRYTYNQFCNLIRYLDYTLNGQSLPILEHIQKDSTLHMSDAGAHQQDELYSSWETKRHETFVAENMILSTIRDGDSEGLRHLLELLGQTVNLREGPVADTPLRQAKNIFIGLVCLVGKSAAIPGGMDDEAAYALIDLYSQECERAATVTDVKLLQYNMLMDFAQRVEREKLPPDLSPEITRCVQFLRSHITGDISFDEIAGFVGKSRSWLTRQFKAELGQSVGEYQTYLRLQKAKRLLRCTSASLIEISTSLGFSSQAYFQTVFKKATGMTPREYRQQDV